MDFRLGTCLKGFYQNKNKMELGSMQVEEDAPSKPILGTIKNYEEGSPNKGNLRRKGRES